MKKKEVSIVSLILLLLISSFVHAAEKGKIAVAVQGKEITAQVSEVAGRSPHFLIFDQDGKLLEAVDNPHQADRRGAGGSVASFLAQKGVVFVVAGEFGEKMSQALKAKGIGYLEFHGSGQDALKRTLEERQKR